MSDKGKLAGLDAMFKGPGKSLLGVSGKPSPSEKIHVHGPGCNHGPAHGEPGHVHGPGCSHDHGRAEAKPHVHGPGCNHGPDEHDDQDEPGHVHGPNCNHGPKKRVARPPQTRPAETGGAGVQFALDDLLPEETDEDGIFEHFEQHMRGHRGVTEVHIRRDAGRPEVCIHHDSAAIGTAQLIDAARKHGANVS